MAGRDTERLRAIIHIHLLGACSVLSELLARAETFRTHPLDSSPRQPYPIPYSLSNAKENGPRRGRILALGLCPLSFHGCISFRNRARPMRVIEPREYTLCGQST